MAYSTTAQVKEVLGITETTWDTEITACITDADARIDNKLRNYESTLPLSPVPAQVSIISKYFAASLFRERRDPAGAKAFVETALAYLSEYINEKYFVGVTR